MSSAQDTKATRPKEAVVQRCYDVAPEACVSAVALLLQSPADMKKAARPGGQNDGPESKEDSADAPIIPRR